MLLTHRKLLLSKAIDIENDLRGTLRNFGLKVGVVGTVKFEARIKELVPPVCVASCHEVLSPLRVVLVLSCNCVPAEPTHDKSVLPRHPP
jgi:hypothetical protein